jgi:DNA polymerase III alpha subunit
MGQTHGLDVMALTDINNTSACLSIVRLTSKYGIQSVLHIDFRNGARQLYVALAENNTGFEELNRFLSKHSHQKTECPQVFISKKIVFDIY